MTWRVDFSPAAQRDLNQVSARVGPAVLEFIYVGIAVNPQRPAPTGGWRGKPLRGEMAGVWSARRGDYRVLYRIDETSRTVQVVRVAGRGIAYRPL